jgi:hypothetical protein
MNGFIAGLKESGFTAEWKKIAAPNEPPRSRATGYLNS